MQVLGFTSTRLGLWSVLPKEIPTKKKNSRSNRGTNIMSQNIKASFTTVMNGVKNYLVSLWCCDNKSFCLLHLCLHTIKSPTTEAQKIVAKIPMAIATTVSMVIITDSNHFKVKELRFLNPSDDSSWLSYVHK